MMTQTPRAPAMMITSPPHWSGYVMAMGDRAETAMSTRQRPRTCSTTASLQIDARPNNSFANAKVADSAAANTDHNSDLSDQSQACTPLAAATTAVKTKPATSTEISKRRIQLD
jgi:hypothetical protein